jgi:tetrahydromethanopterin S-methyltransferase subunit E
MKEKIIEKISALMTAAFGLVAALAWNDAIKSLFNEGGALYFMRNGGPWIYAVLVTILAVILMIWIAKIEEKAKNTKIKKK